MADVTTASIIPLHQPRPKTPAERAKAYRARKRARAGLPVRFQTDNSAPEVVVTKAGNRDVGPQKLKVLGLSALALAHHHSLLMKEANVPQWFLALSLRTIACHSLRERGCDF
jgi:hypothetical protein